MKEITAIIAVVVLAIFLMMVVLAEVSH